MVSVVVPVFNAVSYLEVCVKSLRALPLKMEIILVDDGSTDGSGALCDMLGDQVIHQSNQGVSTARNAGLKSAKGDWLWFVDADDFVEPVTSAFNLPEEGDFVNLGFVWEEGGRYDAFGASSKEIPYNLWRCWFRRELIEKNGIRFTVGRKYAEDQEFILRYLLSIQHPTIDAIPQILYHYTVRQGSAMTKKGVKGKQLCDVIGVIFSMWGCALSHRNVPSWIWLQTKRMLKTGWVTLIR